MQRIIVLAGQAGNGKDTAAIPLMKLGFAKMALAGPLKEMLESFLMIQGVDLGEVSRYTHGDLKEVATPLLGGRTPRHAMQTLGTEWGRKLLSETLWLEAWKRSYAREGVSVVVTDCRFSKEAEYLKKMGAEIFVIRRPGFTKPAEHASEDLSWAEGYPIIWNDGTVEKLHAEVLAAVKP